MTTPHGQDVSPPGLPTIATLSVSGTPHARGRAHGEHFRAAIGAAVETVAALHAGADAGVIGAALQTMAQHVPTMAEELAGIAEGAGVGVEALAVLNGATVAATRVADGGHPLAYVDAGGTSVYCSGPEGPMLGHLLDLPRALATTVFVLDVAPDQAEPGVLVVTTPGVLGLVGLNARGMAVSSLGLHCGRATGVPFAAVTRALLVGRGPAGTVDGSTVGAADSALRWLRRVPRAGGRYWIVTDGLHFVGAETSVEYVVRTQRGAKAAHLHTNHCFDPVLRRDEMVPRDSTTFSRINVASTVYAQQRPRTPEALWTLLNAHADGPLGRLCRHDAGQHADPGDASTRAVTAAIVVVRPQARTLRVVAGCSRRGTPRLVTPTQA